MIVYMMVMSIKIVNFDQILGKRHDLSNTGSRSIHRARLNRKGFDHKPAQTTEAIILCSGMVYGFLWKE